MGRMGRASETRWLANSLGEKPHGAENAAGSGMGSDGQSSPRTGGRICRRPGGRELGSAELGAPNGLRQPQTDPSATAVTAPVSPAESVTSGTLPAPPTRAPPTRRPGCARGAEAAGAEGAHWRPAGKRREPEEPAARLRDGGRPPSLSGRRAASLAGGEEGAVALSSASRSSLAHAPALRARANSLSRPPPLPRLPLSRWGAHRQHPSPGTNRHQPQKACSPREQRQVTVPSSGLNVAAWEVLCRPHG
ncbi:uncharacterized protein WM277_019409 [Molossus nigricans]